MCGALLLAPTFDQHGGMEKRVYEVRSLFMADLQFEFLWVVFSSYPSFNMPTDSICAKLFV